MQKRPLRIAVAFLLRVYLKKQFRKVSQSAEGYAEKHVPHMFFKPIIGYASFIPTTPKFR